MQEIDVFADSLRYALQCCCQNTFFLKDKPPFNIKVPKGYASFDSVANPLEVKHLSISEVRKLSDTKSAVRQLLLLGWLVNCRIFHYP